MFAFYNAFKMSNSINVNVTHCSCVTLTLFNMIFLKAKKTPINYKLI